MGIQASYQRVKPDAFHAALENQASFHRLVDERYERGAELEEKGEYLEIDKEWQSIHYLLTGKVEWDTTTVPPPLGNVVMGGTNTPYDATYDYFRYLTPAEVKDVANALSGIPPEELRARNANATEATYKNVPPAEWDDEYWEFILGLYGQIRTFFAAAASAGEVVILSYD
ncbi:MAG TPA: YfbM family protein [Blastocatellia bacterium]|nr:YfbM family protein [Blastocatellia bacterium]